MYKLILATCNCSTNTTVTLLDLHCLFPLSGVPHPNCVRVSAGWSAVAAHCRCWYGMVHNSCVHQPVWRTMQYMWTYCIIVWLIILTSFPGLLHLMAFSILQAIRTGGVEGLGTRLW